MSDQKEFLKILYRNAIPGFQQFYLIAAESTVKHLCGRWCYDASDDIFKEFEVFPMESIPDSGLSFGSAISWEKLLQGVDDRYVSLFRVPKQAYKQMYPETILF